MARDLLNGAIAMPSCLNLAHRWGFVFALSALCLACVVAGCGRSHGIDPADMARDSMARLDAGSVPSDASRSIDAPRPVDAPSAPDPTTPPNSCSPANARPLLCPDIDCDAGPSWFWNGDSCVPMECGACVGEDCNMGASTQEQCERDHASCEASLCRNTGGIWRWWDNECGYWCGRPDGDCEDVGPTCDCGLFGSFDPSMGCVPDDCPVPEPVSQQELCEGTGGTWGAFCCDSVCGTPCPLFCAELACDCGPGREFLDTGCRQTARCFERQLNESCDESSRCAPGTICCSRCTDDNCRPATCQPPTCSHDGTTDFCGNPCDGSRCDAA